MALRENADTVAEQLRRTTSELEIAQRAANAAKHNRTKRITDLEKDLQSRDTEIKSLQGKLATRDATIEAAKRAQQYAVNQSYTRLDGLRAAGDQHERCMQQLRAEHAQVLQRAADEHAEALRHAADLRKQLASELEKARAAFKAQAYELEEMAAKARELEMKASQL
eukprot:3511516-Pleurochrysis_carterae.AAC.1